MRHRRRQAGVEEAAARGRSLRLPRRQQPGGARLDRRRAAADARVSSSSTTSSSTTSLRGSRSAAATATAYLDAMEREGGVVGRLLGHAVLDKRIPPLWENRPEDFHLAGEVLGLATGADRPLAATSATARGPAGYDGPIWIVPHPAFPVPDLGLPRTSTATPLFGDLRQCERQQARPPAARGIRASAAASTRQAACCSSARSRRASISTGGYSVSGSTAPASCREGYVDERRLGADDGRATSTSAFAPRRWGDLGDSDPSALARSSR